MRAWIVSDLHVSPMDFLAPTIAVPEADICICVGDVSNNITTSINFLRRMIEPHMRVILILGNHDYYDGSIDFVLDSARRQIAGTRVQLLENQTIHLEGCRLIGATLWTDFLVSVGDDEHLPPEERRALALGVVPHQIADFHSIFRSDERGEDENGLITARELLGRHKESRAFIDTELGRPFSGRTIVLTHHAPHPASSDPRFFGQPSSAAFVSDLSDLIARRKPDVWIHGHVHRFRDYMVDGTRVLCNPRGYRGELGLSGFRPRFVIDL
ncbi:metallophosphoesterase [Rhizobium leguminosarum]|uniref:metallophosphoesterase n=1 Tax=Rhizobium leguminosarum TaxID=384 RepID=UPI0014417362|nr:metallophosphoesterase [Rhizobium leguminosarum]NKN01138.1 phosphohydrolase [Rhizobium leguminosarum bv. viciae]